MYLRTVVAVSHGYEKIITGIAPDQLEISYDVVVWGNDDPVKPIRLGKICDSQFQALMYGETFIKKNGRIAKFTDGREPLILT